MSTISGEQPPSSTSPELAEYLARMFRDVDIAVDNTDMLEVRYILPVKPVVGKLYYFGAAIPTTAITAEGYWGYKSTGWIQIA